MTPPSIVIAGSRDRSIPARSVRALFDTEPWWPERTVHDIETVLGSFPAVGAWDGGELVGFARAMTDGVFRAQIEDVLVLKAYRGAGIGKRLVQRLLEDLAGFDAVTLFCHQRLLDFYTDLGFTHFSKQVVMHRKRPNPPESR